MSRPRSDNGAAPTTRRRTFWIANAIIMLDETVYLAILPLLPYYAERFGLSATEIGLLYAAYPMLGLLMALPAGALVDRFGARRVLILAGSLFVIASIGFASAESTVALWVSRALQGVAGGLSVTTGMAALADGMAPLKSGSGLGGAAALQGLSAFVGPALGGFLAPALGTAVAFTIPAVLMLPLIVMLIRDPESPGLRAPPSTRRVRRMSLDARVAAAMFLGIGILGSSVQALTPTSLGALDVGPDTIGAAFLLAAGLGLLLLPVAGRSADALGVTRATAIWLPLAVGLAIGIGFATDAWLILILFVLFLPQVRVGGVLGYVRGARGVRIGGGLGSGYGAMITAWSLGATVGPIAAGAALDLAGDAAAFTLVALFALLLAWPATQRRYLSADDAPLHSDAYRSSG